MKSNCDLETILPTQTPEDRKVALENINKKISATDVEKFDPEVSDLVVGKVTKKRQPFTEAGCSDKLICECKNAHYIKLFPLEASQSRISC